MVFCCLFVYSIAKQVSKSFLIRSLGVGEIRPKAVGETGQKRKGLPEIQVRDLLNARHAALFRSFTISSPLGKPVLQGGSHCLAYKRSSPVSGDAGQSHWFIQPSKQLLHSLQSRWQLSLPWLLPAVFYLLDTERRLPALRCID